MRFEAPLVEGTLVKRYKRFLADIALHDGSVVTRCPNSVKFICRQTALFITSVYYLI